MIRGRQQSSGKKLSAQDARGGGDGGADCVDESGSDVCRGEARAKEWRCWARLAERVLELCGIVCDQICSQLMGGQIHELVRQIKGCRITIVGTRGFKEAMVTAGGIALTEVDPKTMASKKVGGAFFDGRGAGSDGASREGIICKWRFRRGGWRGWRRRAGVIRNS